MKRNIIKGMLTLSIAIAFSSCKDLDEDPGSLIVEEQFYKTQEDAIAAVAAVYSSLNSDIDGDFPIYGRNLNLLIGNGSDDQVFSPSNTNPDVRALGTATLISSNDRVLKNWRQHYYGINRANIAIEKIPEIDFDETLKARLINEAKFIRGLLYFNLVRIHGDVPLILENPTDVNTEQYLLQRTPKDQVYEQIISDLNDASNLPNSYAASGLGRATSASALGLLGKIYVTLEQWENAKSTLEKVISTGTFDLASGAYGFDLFPNFIDAFQKPTKNGIEHVFSVQYESNLGAVNSYNALSSTNFGSFNPSVYPGDIPDERLVEIFEDFDTRKDVTFFTELLNPATGQVVNFGTTVRFKKFIDFTLSPLTTQWLSGVNFPVLRYADILLLYAETLNELGLSDGAHKAVNIVRARAYGVYEGNGNYANHGYDLNGLNYNDLREAIFLERRKEFVQESNRWFDLVRKGTLVEDLHKIPAKSAASAKNYLYPIPQVEIDLNPLLTQNLDW